MAVIAREPTVHPSRILVGQVAHAVIPMTVDEPYHEMMIHRPVWAEPTAVVLGFLGLLALIVAAIASSVAFFGLIGAIITFYLTESFQTKAIIGGLMMIVHLLGFYMYLPGRHRVMLGFVLGALGIASIGVGVAGDFSGFVLWIVIAVILTHGAAVGGLQLMYNSERLTSQEQWRAKHLRSQQCPHCLYDIRYLPGPRCPECGGPV